LSAGSVIPASLITGQRSDPYGYAGLPKRSILHLEFAQKLALSTLLGVGSSPTFTGENNLMQVESPQKSGSQAGVQLTS